MFVFDVLGLRLVVVYFWFVVQMERIWVWCFWVGDLCGCWDVVDGEVAVLVWGCVCVVVVYDVWVVYFDVFGCEYYVDGLCFVDFDCDFFFEYVFYGGVVAHL